MIEKNKESSALLEIKGLSISIRQFEKGLIERNLCLIRNIDMTINKGEIIAVVGASGSGKSLLANSILGLLPKNASLTGTMNFKGKILEKGDFAKLRGNSISLIPQSASALDPLMKTGKQVEYKIKAKNKKGLLEKTFQRLRLPSKTSRLYPFELSGGMTRRVLASIAIVSTAELIIADEPTPGLDPEALNETTGYFKELAEAGKGVMFITHDIETALKIANKVAVLYGGQIVEITKAENFSNKGEKLLHPYTKALWNAIPQNGFTPLPGNQPLLGETYKGCIFQSRCPLAGDKCQQKEPSIQYRENMMVRCFYA